MEERSEVSSNNVLAPAVGPTSSDFRATSPATSLPECVFNGLPAHFPGRLYAMIEDAVNNGYSHVISWQPHGRCFRVHDKDQFVQEVLPLWFSMKTYQSFQRQLNIYSFQRIPRGPDKDGYYHPYFVYGNKALAHLIPRRKSNKGTGPRKADWSIPIPDFSRMPPPNVAPENRATPYTPAPEEVPVPIPTPTTPVSHHHPVLPAAVPTSNATQVSITTPPVNTSATSHSPTLLVDVPTTPVNQVNYSGGPVNQVTYANGPTFPGLPNTPVNQQARYTSAGPTATDVPTGTAVNHARYSPPDPTVVNVPTIVSVNHDNRTPSQTITAGNGNNNSNNSSNRSRVFLAPKPLPPLVSPFSVTSSSDYYYACNKSDAPKAPQATTNKSTTGGQQANATTPINNEDDPAWADLNRIFDIFNEFDDEIE